MPGESFSMTFTTIGSFGFFCGLHGAALMSGTITVTPVGAGSFFFFHSHLQPRFCHTSGFSHPLRYPTPCSRGFNTRLQPFPPPMSRGDFFGGQPSKSSSRSRGQMSPNNVMYSSKVMHESREQRFASLPLDRYPSWQRTQYVSKKKISVPRGRLYN